MGVNKVEKYRVSCDFCGKEHEEGNKNKQIVVILGNIHAAFNDCSEGIGGGLLGGSYLLESLVHKEKNKINSSFIIKTFICKECLNNKLFNNK